MTFRPQVSCQSHLLRLGPTTSLLQLQFCRCKIDFVTKKMPPTFAVVKIMRSLQTVQLQRQTQICVCERAFCSHNSCTVAAIAYSSIVAYVHKRTSQASMSIMIRENIFFTIIHRLFSPFSESICRLCAFTISHVCNNRTDQHACFQPALPISDTAVTLEFIDGILI